MINVSRQKKNIAQTNKNEEKKIDDIGRLKVPSISDFSTTRRAYFCFEFRTKN